MTGQLADPIVSDMTAETLMAKDTDVRERPTIDEVSRLAYHLYEQRGRQNGHDVEDWLVAERELRHHYA